MTTHMAFYKGTALPVKFGKLGVEKFLEIHECSMFIEEGMTTEEMVEIYKKPLDQMEQALRDSKILFGTDRKKRREYVEEQCQDRWWKMPHDYATLIAFLLNLKAINEDELNGLKVQNGEDCDNDFDDSDEEEEEEEEEEDK